MILYHVTLGENLPSILRIGIWPRFRQGMAIGGAPKDAVWLTDDPLWIVERQSGWGRADRNDARVVAVRCVGLRVLPYMAATRFPKPLPHEFLVEGIVPPEHLIASGRVAGLSARQRRRRR